MLRKDVKLGFAIGGIMLAVVVVYVLVVPSGDKKTIGVVTDDSQPAAKTDATPTPGTPDVTGSDAKLGEPPVADKTNAPPADPTKADAGQSPATMPSAVSSVGTSGTTSGGPDWNKLLSEGSSSPTMMSETPSVAPKGSDAQIASTPPDAAASTTPTPSADQPAAPPAVADNAGGAAATPDLAIDTTSTPATQPAASGERTHIVQPGETLTAISQAAFGTSRKWKLIAQANPNINPNRLAPGTKLVIPAASSVDASSAVLASSKIDSSTQYEVQPSDSLYRISMKLYGKPDHVDKLYQDNKDVIGADPRRLKLHEVLKLTDPPTTASH